MLPRLQRLGEMPELPITRDVRHRLPIHDERRSWLGTTNNFSHAPVKLRALNFKHHVLRFALRHQRELKRLTNFAGLLLGVLSGDIPEILAGIETDNVRGGTRN